MKTKTLLCVAALLAATLRAEEKKSCCDACCAAEKSSAVAVPVSDRSLYQLDAAWTDDAGQRVALASLRGQPVVLAMFFASCEYACPILVHDMQRLRDALPAEARAKTRFVLVSFDTVRDTPAALHAYRERSQLDASWTLLHGDADAVQELAMLLGVKYKQDARGQFSHSNLITVLNAGGEIAHQRNGLQGEIAEAARAVVALAK
ncbi:MAG TPA: SCO family protein [Opitutaceae bacterium]|nr:SCO family protein [Opitutaceae bacterium]